MLASNSSPRVGIYWDYQNIRIPKGYATSNVINSIQQQLVQQMPTCRFQEKRFYYDSRQHTESKTDRESIDLLGYTIVDCPTRNTKETMDKKMIVDILTFAYDHLLLDIPACVVLISSDGDYSYTLSRLRDKGIKTVVVYGLCSSILLDCCDHAIPWSDILRRTLSPGGVMAIASSSRISSAAAIDLEDEPITIAVSSTSVDINGSSTPCEADDAMSEISDVGYGEFLQLCKCIHGKQNQGASKPSAPSSDWKCIWVEDAKVGIDYPKYKHQKASALHLGLIEVGRKLIATGEIKPINSSISMDLSLYCLHTYVRLTDRAITLHQLE